MPAFRRLAIYHAPPAGALASKAAAWLGWDAALARAEVHPDLGLPVAGITGDPRRYGFHATLKPPFRLAEGQTLHGLSAALDGLGEGLSPVTLPGLGLRSLGGFLALMPEAESPALQQLAAAVVTGLDRFRAPLNAAEIARRRPDRLSPRQAELLALWGYPFVMEEFRFHLTLTDRLEEPLAAQVAHQLADWLMPVVPRPYPIADLCLFGEREEDGQFVLVSRHPLRGGA